MADISIKDTDNIKIGFDEGAYVKISTDKNKPIAIQSLSNYNIKTKISSKDDIKVNLTSAKSKASNYTTLINKPSINGHTLIGDQKGKELDLIDSKNRITEQEIDEIIYGG